MNKINTRSSVILNPSEKDKNVPDNFYSTTNYTTKVFYNNKWLTVQNQRMDALIVIKNGAVACKKLREIKKGDMVVCTDTGVKVIMDEGNADHNSNNSFNFMNNNVSSERRNELIISNLADELFYENKKLTVVAGPVIVHTGGDYYLSELIRDGYVASLLTGNAVPVHDIEKSFYGTSLGVCSKSGRTVKDGYKNHMKAINQVTKYGSIQKTVEAKILCSGIMYECVKNNIPFVLAGSLRDDGPLPDTLTDMIDAQDAYNEQLTKADIVLVIGTMLHGIACGNMLPAKTKMICVDINPAVVTKLSDRGSGQAIGIVTDVGLFLKLLANELSDIEKTPRLAANFV